MSLPPKQFSLGGLYTNFELLQRFIPAIRQTNIGLTGCIDSVFGSFPTVIWNGGRNILNYGIVSLPKAESVIEYFHKQDIPIRFVFTNSLLQKKHLNDYYSNEILSMIDENIDWIILSSPILYDYVKHKFPNLKIVRSITTIIPEYYDNIINNIDNFDLTVLPVEYCFDGTLKNIPYNLRDKCEILVNERCQHYCPHKLLHHKVISQGYLDFDVDAEQHFCSTHNVEGLKSSMILSPHQVNEIYELGYTHFKIAARNSKDALARYCRYLLPEEKTQLFLQSFIEK